MLRFVILALIFLSHFLSVKAQSVGIFGGTLTASPSNTVTDGTSVSVYGMFKNTGSTTITDYLHLNLAIDTSSTATPKYYWRSTVTYSVTNFAPGATHTFVVTDVASTTNSYKVGGNGTTVIVWPIAGAVTNSLTTHDTARTIIYIAVPNINGIQEFEASPILLKNPVNENVILNYDESVYERVELINMEGQCVENAIKENILQVTDCSKGLYFLRFYHRDHIHFVTKKIMIQ